MYSASNTALSFTSKVFKGNKLLVAHNYCDVLYFDLIYSCSTCVVVHTGCLKKKGDVFIGPQIEGFSHPVFSSVCIGRLGQWAL